MRGVIRKSLAVAAGLLFLVPASALAGEASVVNGVPQYDAFLGETNHVVVGQQPGPAGTKKVIYRDTVEVKPGPGCSRINDFAAECGVQNAPSFARAFLGNGNDSIDPSAVDPLSNTGLSVQGNTGADELNGGPARDLLDGGDGPDEIRGALGNDDIEGEGGEDLVIGDGGNDTLSGGIHGDTLIGGTGVDNLSGDGGDDVLNGDDNAGGDSLNCGESLFDDDLAIFNGANAGNPGDVVFSNCERTQQG